MRERRKERRKERKESVAAVLLGVLLSSPYESTDESPHHTILLRAEVQCMSWRESSPRRTALPKAWALKTITTSRKLPSDIRPSCTHFLLSIDVGKIGKKSTQKMRNTAQTPH
jgi:hypothetical protein